MNKLAADKLANELCFIETFDPYEWSWCPLWIPQRRAVSPGERLSSLQLKTFEWTVKAWKSEKALEDSACLHSARPDSQEN